MQISHVLALDVGTKRIGIAYANTDVRIAIPQPAVMVDGNEFANIGKLIDYKHIDTVVLGYPRNNSGETTRQTKFVEEFAATLRDALGEAPVELCFQDESWTSEEAKDHLAHGKTLSRADRDSGLIDSEAAAIILQDYLDSNQKNTINNRL